MLKGTTSGIFSLMVITLCLSLLPGAATDQGKPQLFQEGQQIYTSNCADCHRSNGEGLPNSFPALKGNSFVMGDPVPVMQTILDGRKGKLGRMPAWKDTLTDQQIAAVISFIRNNWGNAAEAVMPELVAKNRKK